MILAWNRRLKGATKQGDEENGAHVDMRGHYLCEGRCSRDNGRNGAAKVLPGEGPISFLAGGVPKIEASVLDPCQQAGLAHSRIAQNDHFAGACEARAGVRCESTSGGMLVGRYQTYRTSHGQQGRCQVWHARTRRWRFGARGYGRVPSTRARCQ
eukprot:scaffold144883_cov29-Tisochrysis_lutea.AAC.2